MLVAMLILGVLFAGAAGALISFSQASVNNERRVQSTALLNRLHEELQALHWDNAVLYDEELAAARRSTVWTPPAIRQRSMVNRSSCVRRLAAT
jgi:type II secretory pathway pseudopilin PulG